jgi:hypothetical protein
LSANGEFVYGIGGSIFQWDRNSGLLTGEFKVPPSIQGVTQPPQFRIGFNGQALFGLWTTWTNQWIKGVETWNATSKQHLGSYIFDVDPTAFFTQIVVVDNSTFITWSQGTRIEVDVHGIQRPPVNYQNISKWEFSPEKPVSAAQPKRYMLWCTIFSLLIHIL